MHIIGTAIEFWSSRISGAKNGTKLPCKHMENTLHNCLYFTDSRLLKKTGTVFCFFLVVTGFELESDNVN